MQDLPDFDDLGRESGSQVNRLNRRPGVERIPAFDSASSVTVQIDVMNETYDELRRVIMDNEWEPEEGMRTVLLTGLGFLEARERLGTLNRAASTGNVDTHEQVDALVNDLARYHQQYSVMKFKAFKLYKLNQVMEFNISGLRETERMWETWAARMRRQHSELQTEVIRLRSLMSEFKIDWDSPLSREAEAGLRPAEPPAPELTPPPAPAPAPSDFVPDPQARSSLWSRFRRLLGKNPE